MSVAGPLPTSTETPGEEMADAVVEAEEVAEAMVAGIVGTWVGHGVEEEEEEGEMGVGKEGE